MVFRLHTSMRMRSILLAIAIAALAAFGAIRYLPASMMSEAEAEPARVRAQEVQSISIDGRGLPLASLRAVLTTQVGQLLDAKVLERDRGALESELSARGYLAARVELASVTFAANGGAFVSFQIAQGALFHLRSVTVMGATERDAGVVTLSSGDEANAGRIERARQTLLDNLVRRGKASQVEVTMQLDVASALVDVKLVTRKR